MAKYLNFSKGVKGEVLAEKFLKKNNYKIIQKNYRTKLGEVDIIAKDKDSLCFVEVKYRENLDFGYPREAVNKTKQQNIKKVAKLYLLQNKIENTFVRFDIVEIINENITLIKNAFC